MNIAKLVGLFVRTASAHCDTEDGPAVTDGRRALEIGNVTVAIRQHHVESSVVHDGSVEIGRRERKHRLDAVRRA